MRASVRRALCGALAALTVGSVYGHVDPLLPTGRSKIDDLWNLEPVAVASLLVFAAMYFVGWRHMPKKIRRDGAWFFSGWLMLVAALISPIHRLGGWLFSVHMVQHELLMVVAAPLLILGRPGVVTLRAFPPRIARNIINVVEKLGWVELWEAITRPGLAWLIHGFALWIWHVPAFFEMTFSHAWIHGLQHVSFFGSALLFWYSLFRDRTEETRFGPGILSLFTTAVHTSVLGALITFSPKPLYPSYVPRAPFWGLTALQDQQIGGLIMWVPAGVV